jgi:hypothetical protein
MYLPDPLKKKSTKTKSIGFPASAQPTARPAADWRKRGRISAGWGTECGGRGVLQCDEWLE